jgi:tetratricopeptide (TPR) repeat protein
MQFTTILFASTLTLFHGIHPKSLSENLAFYQLYPESEEGKIALSRAIDLIQPESQADRSHIMFDQEIDRSMQSALQALIALVSEWGAGGTIDLSGAEIDFLDSLGSKLPHRVLKGHSVTTREEMLALAPNEIDLARALLISLGESGEKIRSYEALLDLMALHIIAALPPNATPIDKIDAMNRFVFDQMRFRFPPHAVWAEEVDEFTFLPAIIDSRRGVCLGVSTLYLSLAQRIDLPLEIITPPGHIYVRYNDGQKVINIETTARGIHLPSEAYLGMNAKPFEPRSIREVVGMTHFNHASVLWQKGDYKAGLAAYMRAGETLGEDPLLLELTAYMHLALGEKGKGDKLLQQLLKREAKEGVGSDRDSFIQDYLSGNVDIDGILKLFEKTDHTRASIVCKQELVAKKLEEYPKFRGGLFYLATGYLQLHRPREALEILERYHRIDPTHPGVEYTIAYLQMVRENPGPAKEHLGLAVELTSEGGVVPKPIKDLLRTFRQQGIRIQ